MTRRLTLVLALALTVAACGDGGESPAAPNPSEQPQTTVATPSTDSGAIPTTTAVDDSSASETAAVAQPEGPDAPDFSLALNDGGEFVLSAEQKPVYMVFWAEW